MSDLSAFLLARITEDEEYAQAASVGQWWSEDELLDAYMALSDDSHRMADARLAARHDPARVLAECDAKRRIIEEWKGAEREAVQGDTSGIVAAFALSLAMHALALPYADHPDYDETWRP